MPFAILSIYASKNDWRNRGGGLALSTLGLVAGLFAGLFAMVGCGSEDSSASNAGSVGGSGGADGSADGDGGSDSGGTGGTSGTGGDAAQSDVDSTDGGCTEPCDGPGEVCLQGQCVQDCRRPGATPCAGDTVCDVGGDHEGLCVAPDAGCVITSEPEVCETSAGGSGIICGPGAKCDGEGECYPRLPCEGVVCEKDHCWGTNCACTRPAPLCKPAPLGTPGETGTLNDYVFMRCGTLSSCDGGIFDLDFDQACNAYGVTMISGPDYLRKIDPSGKVTEYVGVTNLNMGEVATIKGRDGQFGGGLVNVALTYICCESCGCIISGAGSHPQGVAELDPGTSELPMRIPSTKFTTGAGPFGNSGVDTGPYGLTWGLDRVLYAGNIEQNGDFHAIDLETNSKQVVTTFETRVYAAAPFDRNRMLVAVEGGTVSLVPVLGKVAPVTSLITLPGEVTSLARDPWSGRVYASLNTLDIVSFSEDGDDLQVFQVAPALGRISLAPDGYLYHLTLGWPSQPAIVRWELPQSL